MDQEIAIPSTPTDDESESESESISISVSPMPPSEEKVPCNPSPISASEEGAPVDVGRSDEELTVTVDNIPVRASESHLVSFFTKIKKCRMCLLRVVSSHDSITKFAVFQCEDKEALRDALALNGHNFFKLPLSVKVGCVGESTDRNRDRMSRTVCVRNIDAQYPDTELRALFAHNGCGIIQSLALVHPNPYVTPGCDEGDMHVLVEFMEPFSAKKALELNGFKLGKKLLKITSSFLSIQQQPSYDNIHRNINRDSPMREGRDRDQLRRTILIESLSQETPEHMLAAFLRIHGCGPINEIVILNQRQTYSVCALVEFEDERDTRIALRLDGILFSKRRIEVRMSHRVISPDEIRPTPCIPLTLRVNCTVVVTNLPRDTPWHHLRKFLESKIDRAIVKHIEMVTSRVGRLPQTYAMVEFRNYRTTPEAIRLHGCMWQGHQLSIKLIDEYIDSPCEDWIPKSPELWQANANGSKQQIENQIHRTIVVHNLPTEMSAQDLKLPFRKCGRILAVCIVEPKKARKFTVVGLVEFADIGSVANALKVNGEEYWNSFLVVTRANNRIWRNDLQKSYHSNSSTHGRRDYTGDWRSDTSSVHSGFTSASNDTRLSSKTSTIVVSYLRPDTRRTALLKCFSKFGKICRIDTSKLQREGTVVIEFNGIHCAADAVTLDGTPLLNTVLGVKEFITPNSPMPRWQPKKPISISPRPYIRPASGEEEDRKVSPRRENSRDGSDVWSESASREDQVTHERNERSVSPTPPPGFVPVPSPPLPKPDKVQCAEKPVVRDENQSVSSEASPPELENIPSGANSIPVFDPSTCSGAPICEWYNSEGGCASGGSCAKKHASNFMLTLKVSDSDVTAKRLIEKVQEALEPTYIPVNFVLHTYEADSKSNQIFTLEFADVEARTEMLSHVYTILNFPSISFDGPKDVSYRRKQ